MADLLDQVHADSQGDGDLLDKVHSEDHPSSWMDSVHHFAGEFWKQVNPVEAVKGMAQMTAHPIDTIKAYGQQNSTIAAKAEESFKKGNYAEGVRHVLGYVLNGLPGVGSTIDEAGDKAGSGDVAGGLGETAGLATNMLALELVRKLPPSVTAKIPFVGPRQSMSPEQASAVQMADKEGIPLPVGTRTGDKALINLQGGVANAPGGAPIARAALDQTHAAMDATKGTMLDKIHPEEVSLEDVGREIGKTIEGRNAAISVSGQETADALAKKGQDLADTVHPSPQTPETSATAASQALESLKSDQSSRASSAYDRLAQIEADPANTKSIELRREISPDAKEKLDHFTNNALGKNFDELTDQQKTSALTAAKRLGIDASPQPVTQDLALPVDRRPVKAALKPILDDLRKQMPVAQQQASRGLKAIENIVNGDDYTSASTAEADLSAVKAIQREAVNPKIKYLAGKAITEFAPSVDKAVSAGGQNAIDALKEGRALTKAKYATQETIDKLPTEPVKLYRQLTAPGDASINLLRDVKSKAPDAMPAVARATLQGLLDEAQNGKGIKAAVDGWNKLGDETKLELFGDTAKVKSIDDYMRLRQRVAESGAPGMESPIEGLPKEPVPMFTQLMQAKDRAIEALSTATNAAPGSKPAMARAYVQDLLDNSGPQAALSKWKSLGDSTKEILFPDKILRQKVEDFFNLQQMVGDNPNKSGTAYVTAGQYILKHPVSGLAYALGNNAMARILFRPGGVDLLTKGLKLNLRNPASALAATQILKIAGSGATPIDMPKAAQAEPQSDKTTVAATREPAAVTQ